MIKYKYKRYISQWFARYLYCYSYLPACENISLNYFGPTIDFVGKIQLQPNATIQVIYNLLNEMFGYESLNKYNFTIAGNYSIQGFYQSFATTKSVLDIDLISNKEYFTIVDI